MINARTQLYAVIGDPIAHSLSPVMQNWFIHHFDLDAVYTAFHVQQTGLQACLNGMKAMGIRGLNVTVPHKEAVLPFVDNRSAEVQQLGAANTLKLDDGQITAHVTDPYGFIESLGEQRERFKDQSVLLFGAGGAAKSVSVATGTLGIQRLIVHDVIQEKAEELARLARDVFGVPDAVTLSQLKTELPEIVSQTPIVINATAVGMHPQEDRSVIEDMTPVTSNHFFYDLIYNPGKTRFLHLAQQAGAAVQNGLRMLIFQGLQSLRIWTDRDLQLAPAALLELETLLKKELGLDG